MELYIIGIWVPPNAPNAWGIWHQHKISLVLWQFLSWCLENLMNLLATLWISEQKSWVVYTAVDFPTLNGFAVVWNEFPVDNLLYNCNECHYGTALWSCVSLFSIMGWTILTISRKVFSVIQKLFFEAHQSFHPTYIVKPQFFPFTCPDCAWFFVYYTQC